MSRILRRPMFRGGRVSSYGTGIASGLADGGMPDKRGLVDGPGGYAGFKDWFSQFQVGGNQNTSGPRFTTGSELLYKNKAIPLTLEQLQESFAGGNYAGRNIGETLIRQEVGSEGDIADLSLAETPIDARSDLQKAIDADIGSEQTYREEAKERDLASAFNIDPSSVSALDNKVLEIQNSDDAELSLEEIKEALGGDKARRRDLTDMALLASSKLLKEGATVRSGLSEFMEAEAAKGPSRTEVIDKEAATFMLKDKFQTKRDKAKIDLMRADTDYKLAAGKKVSIQEGILASTKGSNFSDKKLGAGIQYATSDATGEKYKYKGTTTKEGLKAALNSGELKAGDTVIVKETVKVEGQPDKTIKKVIEIQVIDGKLQVVEIYRV